MPVYVSIKTRRNERPNMRARRRYTWYEKGPVSLFPGPTHRLDRSTELEPTRSQR